MISMVITVMATKYLKWMNSFDKMREAKHAPFLKDFIIISHPLNFSLFFIHILRSFMENWKKLQDALIAFRNERDWEQFHNPKDLALALSIEAAELNELFLWKKADEANPEKIREELADVFAYAILLAEKYDLDINEIVLDKIKRNGEKYPVDKAKGTATKYTDL